MVNSNIGVTVIISTKNRSEKIKNCLDSLLANSYKSFEAIVADQSNDAQTKKIISSFKSKKIRYLKIGVTGKSRALNKSIPLARGSILAFIDDDCISDTHWLNHINKSFNDNPQISAVFGKTSPYQQRKHIGYFCPCVFENKNSKAHFITYPCKHWEYIGYGNNMAFRKSFFEEMGGFKIWLGPGSIGSNAEDAEIALRALINKKILFYNPKMHVFHDRWITARENKKQELSYICGEIACYGHFALDGEQFAQAVLTKNMIEIFRLEPERILFLFKRCKRVAFSAVFWRLAKTLARLRGLFVAFYVKLFAGKETVIW